MITRHTENGLPDDVWAKLAADVPEDTISWRQDGRPVARDGKYFARFVAFIEANTVRERLDSVCAGHWDLTLELLPAMPDEDTEVACSFKARLQILGVIREDVGHGKDYKQAATDAFKRVAVRFGIGHELYAYEQNWVQVDGDGKFAKPVEDPGEAYARRMNRGAAAPSSRPTSEPPRASSTSTPSPSTVPSIDERAPLDAPRAVDEPSCPKCGGRMWDNTLTRRNPKAPTHKCRSRSCDGVIWPSRGNAASAPNQNGPDDEPWEPPTLSEMPF